jgi:hypothetical protein
MGVPEDHATSAVKRKRRWGFLLLWVIAILISIGGWSQLVKSATFPRAVAKHPVRTEATVTSFYINGPGGDPGVEYEYSVNGHLFRGSGDGRLGGEPMPLQRGYKVAVEYAAGQPSESCTCDAVREEPPSIQASFLTAAGLTFPLLVLVLRSAPRLVRTRQSWFVPVRGWNWLPFLLGIILAAAMGALLLAYLLAPAVEGWSP